LPDDADAETQGMPTGDRPAAGTDLPLWRPRVHRPRGWWTFALAALVGAAVVVVVVVLASAFL